MGNVIGDLLPLAVGVAISPIPIIATILMLLAPRAGSTSSGFLLGWTVGIVVAITVFTVIASSAGLSTSDGPSETASWVKIVLGVALLPLAGRQWRARPRSDAAVQLPKWMTAIDTITFGKAVGLGFALAAVNPKNLLMCVAAGATIGAGDLTVGESVVSVAVFTVIAACTVAVPVVAYALAKERMERPLGELKSWLEANNATVMSVMLLVIGVALIGKGIGGL
ncbi:MAG TPA: GAP family protein [Nocardioidaceae bacterium]|nr:GAP family protein [Nocardioidaceae bacterium]